MRIRILRIVLVTCVLTAAIGMAGCLPGEPWEVPLNGCWESAVPFVGLDSESHAPSEDCVWRYVDLALIQRTAAVVTLDLEDIALVIGDDSYEPTELLAIAEALPVVYLHGVERSGRLAFDVPDSLDGGQVVMYPSDGAVLAVVLGEETRID